MGDNNNNSHKFILKQILKRGFLSCNCLVLVINKLNCLALCPPEQLKTIV